MFEEQSPSTSGTPTDPPNPYRTNVWEDSFPYGAYTTTVSSFFLSENPILKDLATIEPTTENLEKLKITIEEIRKNFLTLDTQAVKKYLTKADDPQTPTIFNGWRDFPVTETQNKAFVKAMGEHKELRPQNDQLANWSRFPFQFSTHRGLYHAASLIPQNSLGAMLNAYIAGIRSAEFDVLETGDFVNCVIHDLVTNRLDGTFAKPPIYVDKWKWEDIKKTPVGILNPFASKPEVVKTQFENLMTTADFLTIVKTTMPGMTLYVDARNSAPISLFKLLVDDSQQTNPVGLAQSCVVKLYPFELKGGVFDIVTLYAKRYCENDRKKAIDQIRKAKINIMVCTGTLSAELNERLIRTEELDLNASLFASKSIGADSTALAKICPFTTTAESSCYKNFLVSGNKLFQDPELDRIWALTILFTRWVMDFSAIGTVRAFQMGLVPSLVASIKNDTIAQCWGRMSDDQRIASAVNDNFMAIYKAVLSEKIHVDIPAEKGTASLYDLWKTMSFAISDRYPDFAIPKYETNPHSVHQNDIRNFYYNMNGVVDAKDNYAVQLQRSSHAIFSRASAFSYVPPADSFGFAITTDLVTDLRVLYSGLNGTNGFPQWMEYRQGGLVKPQLASKLYSTYKISIKPYVWATQLWGDLREQYSKIADELKQLQSAVDNFKKDQLAIDALEAYDKYSIALTNQTALNAVKMKTPVIGGTIDHIEEGEKKLKQSLHSHEENCLKLQTTFANTYKINWDGTPVTLGDEQSVRFVAQGNWDD